MSKTVKNLVTESLRGQLAGVSDALLVNVVGLDGTRNTRLRSELRKKNIRLEVIKNSLARRATEGTPLAAAFAGIEGTLAIVWGGEDIVSLAKEITRLSELKEFTGFTPRGGAMDGAMLSAAEVKRVSSWPTRLEQLSILVGQLLGPGATLAGQLTAAGGLLASQIKQLGEAPEGDADTASEATTPPVEPPHAEAPAG